MPTMLPDRVLSWADDLDDNTVAQAQRTARLPFVHEYVALMPDAHLGYGATVGSVIATEGALVPYAVGVDIGCGMVAVETTLSATDLPDDLGPLLSDIGTAVPAGMGKGHATTTDHWQRFTGKHADRIGALTDKQAQRASLQFGTLGSGNHFIEVCLDEREVVWVVLHSGSRGIGNELAGHHVEVAKGLMKRYFITLDDPDLAYVSQGTPEFDAYVTDLLWAQDYALANRDAMMDAVLHALEGRVGRTGVEADRVQCHHNYAVMEHHHGRNVWVTRKGAIRARVGDRGVIPGSMGAASYIVRGLGNPASFTSASHGAGRRMSRGEARRTLSADDLTARMGDRTWLADQAKTLLDEHPSAYKDIDEVMAAQADLVEIEHSLRQVLNFKGA